MTLEIFLARLHKEPLTIEFSETIYLIDHYYHYTPVAFANGDLHNAAGDNEGSCKIFAFALMHGLTEAQTLACFGHYYRDEVLGNPEGGDHQNIRQFIKQGWQGVRFVAAPLEIKNG